MNTTEFFELMQAAALQGSRHPDVLDDIIREIECNRGIVFDSWWRIHGHEWDGERWVASGLDIGWDGLPWLWAFKVAGFTHDKQPATPPKGSILLYRAAPPSRRFGMSWTAHYDYAMHYAGLNGAGIRQDGRIYVHRATGAEMLAFHTCIPCERCPIRHERDEYVLDPAYLHDGNVAPFSPAQRSEVVTRRLLSTIAQV